MGAFKAFVSLVRALRNPGMCDRHWDRISEELGIDLHPDDSFTLAKAEELDLLNEEKLKTVMKVSDIAGVNPRTAFQLHPACTCQVACTLPQ